uniref:Potassium/proton antiporter CemA n=1 Tax=Salvinia cucullata TaxID=32188 RepID=A0A291R852_9MONI|nr:chloroplast envelope membrane protein [Salvinia cucullata]
MISHYWKLLRWFRSTPHRSLERAYKVSKHSKNLRTTFSFYKQTKLSPLVKSLRIVETITHTDFNKLLFRVLIYWNLLECRLSLFMLNTERRLEFLLGIRHPGLSSTVRQTHQTNANEPLAEDSLGLSPFRSPNTKNLNPSILVFQKRHYKDNDTDEKRKRLARFRKNESERGYAYANRSVCDELNNLKEMNRKLAWIEAILNDSDFRTEEYSIDSPPFQMEREPIEEPSSYDSIDRFGGTTSYESISLVPRSVTRTLSRFKAELTNHSSSSVLNDFALAKNQSLASIRYIGCLLFIPSAISISLKNFFVEPQIRGWWNTHQPQIFINSFQEEKALNWLRKAEALLWLNDATGISADIQLWNFDTNAYNETIQLAVMYNEANIQLLLQLVTDTISIVILVLLLITGRKRLAVPNPWIQELFYSLNDTMKAFSILLLTDLCVGFHSPHGWEIFVGSSFEHFGLTPNKYAISRFVSTFPVISDTVFKYRIFRHLNRTSPSIVATYHTTSE